ncbi:putative Flagellar hook capping protein FlgD [Candidatus Zixiibacteriota bacterium]|nr:putative Flagellar hook capping protein FlgD [candidate division Zixibacteria bacterium]
MGIISPIAVDSNGRAMTAAAQNTLDKDDFMKLLITKMSHQDPLSPTDDETFIAELAQFSSLEQLQNLNGSLSTSLQWDFLQNQTINNTMATSLIGRQVKAETTGYYLSDNNKPKISFTTDQYAQNVTITIKASDGTVVRTLTQSGVAPGQSSIDWDGKDENGNRLAKGFYTVTLSATDAQGKSFTPSTYIEGKVKGVVYRDGQAYLQVNDEEISLSDVREIIA